jgi:steroid delta-isomerase-like uncharacterized protein
MSIEETSKLDERALKTWNDHDVEAFAALCADDIEWVDTALPEPLRGRAAARQYIQGWLIAFPDIKLHQLNRVVADGSIAAELRFEGTHEGPLQSPGGQSIPPTGQKVTSGGAYFARMRDGKIAEMHSYPDMIGMMAQLGLMSSPPA